MGDVVVGSAVRTALGKVGGSLRDVQPEDLARIVIDAAVRRDRGNRRVLPVELEPGQVRDRSRDHHPDVRRGSLPVVTAPAQAPEPASAAVIESIAARSASLTGAAS